MSTLTTSAALSTAVRPWALDSARRDDRLYHRLQAAGFLLFMALVAVVPQIQLPEPPAIPAPPPVPLTELTLPEKVIPPPPKVELKKPEPPKPEPLPKEKPKEKPVAASKTQPVKPKDQAATLEDAREVAENSGLLALKDDLAELRQAFDTTQTQVAVNQASTATQAVQLERQVIGAASQASFAKAQAVGAATQVGRVALSEKGATKVSEVSLQGLADKNTIAKQDDNAKGNNKNGKSSGPSGRSEAQIRQILEANKSSLYTLYSRALRQNASLRGKVVFELVITPQGAVSSVKIVVSELGDAKLERQLQLRLQTVQFGPAEVSLTRSQWTIEFLPG